MFQKKLNPEPLKKIQTVTKNSESCKGIIKKLESYKSARKKLFPGKYFQT